MKTAKIILLSTLIWSIGLIWPDVNQWLTPQVMLAAVAGLAGGVAGYLLYFLHGEDPANEVPRTRPPDITDSRPFKPMSAA
jgi:hypothetical protein